MATEMISNLGEFNNPAVLRVVWEAFAEFARRPEAMDSSTYFDLVGEKSVCEHAFEGCSEANLIPSNVVECTYAPFKHIVLKVYYSALSMGLVLPGKLNQELDWGTNFGSFHFTADGVAYFAGGFVSIDDPGHLGQVLHELKQRIDSIDDGQIELLLEAQRCVKGGCCRAAMVVVGVASEDVCLRLLEAIPVNCQGPPSGSPLHGDWGNCCNETLSFAGRWKPGVRILEAMKKALRGSAKSDPRWQWWEMIPGSLFTLGEAVRVARNAAAHDMTRKFSKAEAALLLSAMPTQLQMIANVTEFLRSPPADLTPLSV